MDDFEARLRLREVEYQRRGVSLGALALVIGFITALAAVWAAYQAAQAVGVAQDAIARSGREQRLQSGIESLGGQTAAQRIAGVALLKGSVRAELVRVGAHPDESGETLRRDRSDAKAAYQAAVDALENYVGGWQELSPIAGAEPSRSDPGVKDPSGLPTFAAADYVVPKDVLYAANQLLSLVGPDLRGSAVAASAVPSVDLSRADLWGANWSHMDVSWIKGKYFAGIDLRGAILVDTRWGGASFAFARMQCSNLTDASFATRRPVSAAAVLSHADLRGARLVGADLRGVDLRGADLRLADLRGADLRQALVAGARFTQADVTGARFEGAVGLADSEGLSTTAGPAPSTMGDRAACLQRLWSPSGSQQRPAPTDGR